MRAQADLEALAARSLQGETDAVDSLVRALKDDIYNLCMRMLGHPQDAEDATQEILVKIVTRLDSFRGDSGLRTWAWSVASNHLLSVKRSRREVEGLSFETMEHMLAGGIAAALPPPPGADVPLLEEEVKIGCTSTMLACLDREHRLALILGDIFDLTSIEAGEVLGIDPAAFRKRLSRARQRMRTFMEASCGLVSEQAACRCNRQIGPSMRTGILNREHLLFAVHPVRSDTRVRRQYDAIESVHGSTEVFLSHPSYVAPESLVTRLRKMVAASPD